MFRDSTKLRAKTLNNKQKKKARFFKPTEEEIEQEAAAEREDQEAQILVGEEIENGFSNKEMQEFKDSFQLFDTEQEGSISAVELKSVLETMQGNETYPHLQALLKELSLYNQYDRIDFDSYVELMAKVSLHRQASTEETNFAHVFGLFDMDGKDYITIQDLERVSSELGEHDITKQELQEMIERASPGDEGKVSLQDFARIMNLTLFSTEI